MPPKSKVQQDRTLRTQRNMEVQFTLHTTPHHNPILTINNNNCNHNTNLEGETTVWKERMQDDYSDQSSQVSMLQPTFSSKLLRHHKPSSSGAIYSRKRTMDLSKLRTNPKPDPAYCTQFRGGDFRIWKGRRYHQV